MKLFLDLEATLIDNWDDWNPIPHQIDRIKDWIVKNNPESVGVFSAAVWDEKDLRRAKEWCPMLWDMLDIDEISHIPTVDQLCDMVDVQHKMMINVTRQDFFDFFGRKNQMFEIFVQGQFPAGGNFVLFDDAVKSHTKSIAVNDIKWNMEFIQVQQEGSNVQITWNDGNNNNVDEETKVASNS